MFRDELDAVVGISIHAPLRGATHFEQRVNARLDISIHAPLRGATAKMDDFIPKKELIIHMQLHSLSQMGIPASPQASSTLF